ncbi:MAG TPA: hypothetical protein VMM16_14210 [Verrucomicrobiae bacterium]|nr:hypothetical protein [Verrucomicrobiae bacterium]
MFKRTLLGLVLFTLGAPAALCQTKLDLDSKKVTFMAPTGIFVPKGETVTVNATGTVSLTDPNGSGTFTVNAVGVIQTAPDSQADQSYFDFLRDVALPPGLPPSPGQLKFPPGPATLVGAYGALVMGLSPKQCNASSTGDFPNGLINPGTGAGPLPVSGGYLYFGIQRDANVVASGAYALTISLSGQASPPLGCSGGVQALDPVPSLLLPNNTITGSAQILSDSGRLVSAVAADGVTKVVIRTQGMVTGDQIFIILLDENNNIAPTTGEDGVLTPLAGGVNAGPSIVIANVQSVGGINYAFAEYNAPIDFVRSSVVSDTFSGSRNAGILIYDTTTSSVYGGIPLTILRPPVLFVHGVWSSQGTWSDFDTALTTALPGLSTYRADYAGTAGDSIGKNTGIVLGEAEAFLSSFKLGNNAVKLPAAAAQFDFIVHSMGGLISNNMASVPAFKVPSNYGQGFIHKLMTFDTPYLGSEFATGLNGSSDACRTELQTIGTPVAGAVFDLAPGSPFFDHFNQAPVGYPKHAVASYTSSGQTITANLLVNGVTIVPDALSAYYANPITEVLATAADACFSVFGSGKSPKPPLFSFAQFFGGPTDAFQGQNDLIVSVTSQVGPYAPGSTADISVGFAHSNISIPVINLGFAGSLDQGTNTNIGLSLLNESVTSARWSNAH